MFEWIPCLLICGAVLIVGVFVHLWYDDHGACYDELDVIKFVIGVVEIVIIVIFIVRSKIIDIGESRSRFTTSEFQATVSECYDTNDDYYVILTKKNGSSHRYSIAEEDCTLLEVGDIVTVTNKNDGWYYISGIEIQYDSDVTDLTNYSYNYNNTALSKKGENE